MIDIRDHSPYLFGMLISASEILGNAVFKCFSLADIYNNVPFVLHYINAGRLRQAVGFSFKLG